MSLLLHEVALHRDLLCMAGAVYILETADMIDFIYFIYMATLRLGLY